MSTNHAAIIREGIYQGALDGEQCNAALAALDALTREAALAQEYREERDQCLDLATKMRVERDAQTERIKALEEERIGMAKLLIQVRDEIIKDDYQEAYHLVYVFAESIASDLYKPWAELEARAALAPKEAQG